MSNDPVNPGEVPVFTGNLAELETKAKALASDGPKIATAGSDVHTTFGGLSAFYQAPEAEQLFAVTKPVQDVTSHFTADLKVISGALTTYAHDITPLVAKLDRLREDAAKFKTKVSHEDKWREDGDLIEENLDRRNEIAEVWAQFQDVERTCYNKIVNLFCGVPLAKDDGSHGASMYGYDAKALKASKSLPWGDAVEESVPWWQVWEHAYDFGKGVIVDGVVGTFKGLGTLIGVDGWDAAGQAWSGLAKLSTFAAVTSIPGLNAAFLMADDKDLPSWLRDSRTAAKETGKAMLAWDEWGHNPSRAAGAVTFNVVTAICTGGAGGSASAAGKAGAAAKALSFAGKVGQAIDPMAYVFRGAGAGISKIGDVVTGLRGLGKIDIAPFPEGTIALPEGALKLPDGTIHLPEGAKLPVGAVKLSDGAIKLPEGTTSLPPATVRLPFEGGPAKYVDSHGNLYKEDGSLFQHGDEARVDKTPNSAAGADINRIETPDLREHPVLAGVGGRGDDAIKVGSDTSASVRVGDHRPGLGDRTPMGRADGHGSPGGNAGDHTPSSSLDNSSRGGGSHPTHSTPTGGSHTDTPPRGGGGRDLPDASTPDNGHPSRPHPEASGLDALDDAVRARGNAADEADADGAGAGDDAATTARDDMARGTPAPRQPVPRPEFMLDGPNPYGPRGRLELEQIEEIQVYRANEEPGYFEDYYKNNGRRLRLSFKDESGYSPPHLTRMSDDGPWIRAKDAPAAPEPFYLDEDYITLGRDSVTDPGRLAVLDGAAETRHFAVTWDNIVENWKNEAGAAHTADNTFESAGEWAEARGTYKESHTEMGNATEAFGEAAAEHHFIAEHYPGFEKQELLGPNNGKDQFDQVWMHPDGRIVVIEAKSSIKTDLGTRTLPPPSRRSVSQGSREYFFDILRVMNKRGETDLVEALERALDGKLDYVVVKGGLNKGTYNGFQYRRFAISKGTLP
ncbi:hypothetical protein [Streptomyces sp. NPDC060031]|uniref:hypothetical protein n=1 Tax=Streptomyces sp. NPDC060031 TaxID=3347043 RepID=UPI0036C70FB5